MKTRYFLISVLSLGLSAGCGSLKTRDKNEPAVSQVKKVAIIAFQVDRPVSPKVGLNLGSGKLEGKSGGIGMAEDHAGVAEFYDRLAQTLQQKMKWTVEPRTKLLSSTAYRASYKKTMEGWQNKMPVPEGTQRLTYPELMDTDAPRIMGPEGRKELMTQLGLDAVIVANVDVILHGTTVMGFGKRYPQARLRFQVFGKGSPDAIWFDSFEGDKATESVGSTAFIDEAILEKVSKTSVFSAMDRIQ